MVAEILVWAALSSGASFAGMAPESYIAGKVVTFDEKKVKLQVGKDTVYVPRASIAEKEITVGQEVRSVSKNTPSRKRK